jgi:hypothetical protein
MANAVDEQAVLDTVKFARLVKQTYGRSSLTRSAQDTVARFPVIVSGDVPTEDAVILAKALEAQYAALLVSVISANSDYDRAKYSNPSDYLKTFHNNKNIPSLFLSMDSQLPDDVTMLGCAVESATTMYSLECLVSKDVVMECWDAVDGRYNAQSLNGMYKPESYTQKAMEQVVSHLRKIHAPVMEAAVDDVEAAFGVAGKRTGKDQKGAPTGKNTTHTEVISRPQRDENGKVVLDDKGRAVTERVTIHDDSVRSPSATGRQELAKTNDRLTALEPTLVNLQLTSQHGDGPVITHNVVMGVKTMMRVIPQDLMVSNLAEGVNESRAIFKFIKWTEGDYKIGRDLIAGVDSAKEKAVSNRDMKNWLAALKRRKRSNRISQFMTGESMPPITTIVTTTYEVAKVAELTGMDLLEPYTAVKLLSKYFLLGLVIYDPETGRVQSIFDGDVNFSVTTLSGLKTKQQKDQDLTQFAQFIRASGRM